MWSRQRLNKLYLRASRTVNCFNQNIPLSFVNYNDRVMRYTFENSFELLVCTWYRSVQLSEFRSVNATNSVWIFSNLKNVCSMPHGVPETFGTNRLRTLHVRTGYGRSGIGNGWNRPGKKNRKKQPPLLRLYRRTLGIYMHTSIPLLKYRAYTDHE